MEQQQSGLFDLQLDFQALSALNETAKWNKFISIVWFVLCGLMAIGSVLVGTLFVASPFATNDFPQSKALAGISGIFVSFFYLIITAVQFIPTLFRYKFSVRMLRAIRNGDQQLLNESLNQLKYYSKYWGIVTIIVVSIYALLFLFIIAGLLIGLAVR